MARVLTSATPPPIKAAASVDPKLLTDSAVYDLNGRNWFYQIDPGPSTFSNILIYVANAGSAASIQLSCYRNVAGGAGSAARPESAAPIATTGLVACPAIGRALVSLGGPVTLEPGDWLNFFCSWVTTGAQFGRYSTTFLQNVARGRAGLLDGAGGGPTSPSISSSNWFSGRVWYLDGSDL